uniref:Protein tweety homolog n=1 Tax=Timema californicum TaxID=61474 RepID=A0A7R9P6A6_TIMCA|nr:unnamed protein product [Timema californicum]
MKRSRSNAAMLMTNNQELLRILDVSLGILGSLPAAWLILTLLVLLIYLLTRCCDRKPRPKRSIVALKWTLAIFTLLCCAAVGVGLYGNDDVHNGLEQLITAAKSIDDYITSIRNQVTQNSLHIFSADDCSTLPGGSSTHTLLACWTQAEWYDVPPLDAVGNGRTKLAWMFWNILDYLSPSSLCSSPTSAPAIYEPSSSASFVYSILTTCRRSISKDFKY